MWPPLSCPALPGFTVVITVAFKSLLPQESGPLVSFDFRKLHFILDTRDATFRKLQYPVHVGAALTQGGSRVQLDAECCALHVGRWVQDAGCRVCGDAGPWHLAAGVLQC
jgi:hypothetical protein